MGLLSAVGVVFIVLKLIGVITWSWWLVTLPFWAIPVALWGSCLMIILVAVLGVLGGRK